MRVAITGSSGLVGTALREALLQQGHQTVRIPRLSAHAPVDSALFTGCEAVVHLAGEPVTSLRWTEGKKRRIHDSRVGVTRRLADALAGMAEKPATLVCASAIGYYGDRGETVLTEDDKPGQGFLPETCVAWENASERAERAGVRVVHLRIGLVVTPKGGALRAMLPPFRLGLGGPLGTGEQWMSWISLRDLVRVIEWGILTPTANGPFNAVSPHPVRNREWAERLGKTLKRPAILRVPGWALRLALGEMADVLLLSSTRVYPQKLLASDFKFRDLDVDTAFTTRPVPD